MDAADNYSLSLILGLSISSLSSFLMLYSGNNIYNLRFISIGNTIVLIIYMLFCIPYLYYTNIKEYHLWDISLNYFDPYFYEQNSERGKAA